MIKLFFVGANQVVTEQEFQQWKFPAGEIGVKLSEDGLFKAKYADKEATGWCIFWKFESNEEFMIVANLRDVLYEFDCHVELVLPYIPYARQDRVCHIGESFALRVFATMLNSLEFEGVAVFDPHSAVSETMIKNLSIVDQHICAADLPKYDYLIAPDLGASVKIKTHRQVNDLENPTKVVVLSKTRLQDKIVYDDLACGTIPSDAKICVVDDISDGNGTFIALANMLVKTGNSGSQLDLYVTHGIFSKGLDNIRNLYQTVYTANLMNQSLKDDRMLVQLLKTN